MITSSGDPSSIQRMPDAGKRPYVPPVLTVFGHVAALTRGGNCSANSDGVNANCAFGGNMASGGMSSSDRRLKENVVRIGDHPFGFGLYLFDYKPEHQAACGRGRRFGVMADEVEKVQPAAVHTRADGFKSVDYHALGIAFPRS